MTDKAISALTAATTVANTDCLVLNQDAGGGAFNTRQITASNFKAALFAGATLTGTTTLSGVAGTNTLSLLATGTTTGSNTWQMKNTAGWAVIGVDSSTGGSIFTGSSAYATVIGSNNTTSLQFGTNGTINHTITSGAISVTQNANGFGIGMTPSNILDITKNQNAGTAISLLNNSGGGSAYAALNLTNGATTLQVVQFGTGQAGGISQLNTTAELQFATNGTPITFHTNFSGIENGRVGTDGSFLWGTTTNGGWTTTSRMEVRGTSANNGLSAYISGAGTGNGAILARVDATGNNLATFFYNGANIVGSITTSGTTTAYNTTSDKSLKIDFGAYDPGTLFDHPGMAVHNAAWRGNVAAPNFATLFAQDLATVIPHAVRPGDANSPWQVDHIALIPYVIAELQSVRRRLAVANL